MRKKAMLSAALGAAVVAAAGGHFRKEAPEVEPAGTELSRQQSAPEERKVPLMKAQRRMDDMVISRIGKHEDPALGESPAVEEPKAGPAFTDFDSSLIRALAEGAERTGSAESVSALASIIPQTARLDAQNEAYRSLERLAGGGNSEALVAVAQVVPFIIDESTRSDAIYLLSWATAEADEATKGRVASVLGFHLRAGPLSHWSLAGDRDRLADIVEAQGPARR